MSLKYEKLCSLLILEHFGSTVQKIHSELQWGPRSLSLLVSATGLPSGIVKKGLCVMIQYGFVIFAPGKIPTCAEYTLLPEKVILLLRYPRYLTMIKDKYGEPARLLLSEILMNGCMTASKAMEQVWSKIKEGAMTSYSEGIEGMRNIFKELVLNQYVMCCPSVDENTDMAVPKLTVEESQLYQPPEVPLKELINFIKGETTEDPGDGKIYWRANFDRFHQDFRDKLMVNAIRRRFDDHAATLMEGLLNLMYLRTDPWVTHSNPVPMLEIKETVERKLKDSYLGQFLDQYIKIIEDDSSNFIRKQGEGNNSSIYVNIVTAIRHLTAASIENVVEHRFGPKAARIFSLHEKYIDQEQLQKLAMIPDKEAKQLTYKLMQENFLHMKDIRRSGGGGPAKSFYLFHVEFHQVAHIVLEICYKAVYNTLTRAAHERSENVRLIEKHEKLNSIAQCMREQGTDEQHIKELVDEWMSPPEKAQLESIETMIENLRMAELHVDETIFLIQLYTYYETASIRETKK